MKDSFMSIKTESPERKIEIHATVLGKGLNYYVKEVLDINNPPDININGTDYKIDQEALLISGGIKEAIKKKLYRSRYKETYKIIFIEGNSKPLKFENQKIPKLTARMVKVAKDSRALKHGLSDLFATPLTTRKFFFIAIVVIFIIIAVLVATGTLELPEFL